jgi:hypothetical protein
LYLASRSNQTMPTCPCVSMLNTLDEKLILIPLFFN